MSRLLSRAPLVLVLGASALGAQPKPTIAEFLSPASPLELTAAHKADRVAWVAYERGMRNVYTAAAPDFRPVRVTSFLKDDGTEVSDVVLSDDGSTVVFVRGSAPNRVGWIANPSHAPEGAERAIWAARTAGGPAWRVAQGAAPELSPDGRWVLYVKDAQIYRARVAPNGPRTAADTGGVAFLTQWGRQSSPKWSPDGTRIAFVSDRENHALIGVYDTRTRTVEFVAPSVDCDGSPVWSPDGKRLAFVRRPGVPFGAQTQSGTGGIGNPPGPASGRPGASGCGVGGFGGGGRGAQQAADTTPRRTPGLYTATFPGGYTTSVMVADLTARPNAVGGYPAMELWHNARGDRTFAAIRSLMWGDGAIVFGLTNIQGDEWDRYYAIPLTNPGPQPTLLTTTDGLIEDATSAALSRDGKTLFYSTNANDIERRHVWAVPVAGGTPTAITSGEGIETYPQPLASGRQVAVLYFGAKQPASVGLVPNAPNSAAKLIFPTLPKDFPQAAHVVPQIVTTKAADGLEIHNQLFLPADLKPGERRPALVFVHGGPSRQMMPGYHYMQFYHWAYAVNQWLANQGYVVLSINYRSGIGYGRSFRNAQNTNARGNSEYQDVVAGAKYLQSRADVDPSRVGIWGLSYGGLLTSQALARNSDIFVAGADLAGVHLYGNSLDTAALSYKSSAISAIDTWKSPVFLVQGDDDRNVDFAQMVGLVQLLRARNIPFELTVIPDDVHESLIHARWIETWNKMGDFLHRYVWEHTPSKAASR
ncbi:WD40-like beta Propeller containing protein (plasmid) [Gemmatirosa kalamazoonensis]|uniref:WD40-like beta Propeller containing protein n=1 Tax=Gemmatirosa kalamazoonensis TaxID=861299 RepID=W0RQD3_9BACT|nr:prolyl oligopeptidase family serine peptidase [Gemmatirosa kalamazoonensis]AHG92936.1 WD40-like beta Propeller containing protein [Gemmatirosa kalamazoonensis]